MPYSSDAANALLYTPFDTKAIVDKEIAQRLTPQVFLQECYSEPYFMHENTNELTDNNNESYDFIVETHQILDAKAQHIKDQENFFKWLNNPYHQKIYTISGNAGTGKTTYINYLKYSHTDKDWSILDVTKANDIIEWFGNINSTLSNFSTARCKIFATILSAIKEILFEHYDNSGKISTKKIYANAKRLHNNYHTFLKAKHPPANAFINKFAHILRKHRFSKHLLNMDKFAIDFATYVRGYFDELVQKRAESKNDLLYGALDVLFLLQLSNDYAINSSKQHVLVFDNLERFIRDDEIYNAELDEIRRALSSYNRNACQKHHVYRGHFKLIMVLRTNSVRMCGVKLHSADELSSNLDLTEWFSLHDIISKKVAWYSKQSITPPNVQLLDQIVCDLRICNDKELTGLSLFINPLFNDNKRLIVEFIGNIIEKTVYAKTIACYKQMWLQDTDFSRFAARTMIRGLIYHELSLNDNLFGHLKLYTNIKEHDYGLSYVRKILTILYNDRGHDLSLKDILSKLCHVRDVKYYWEHNLSDDNKQNIAEVLYYMNSYNRRDNDWLQFIDMQLNVSKMSVSVEDVDSLKTLIDNKMDNIFIKIMPAGEAYIRYIVASFEFFSFRYNDSATEPYSPLFAALPTDDDFKTCEDVKSLQCYRIIKTVSMNAIGCMNNIKDEDIILHLDRTSYGKYHSQRIIAQHIGFINLFIEYIKKTYLDDSRISSKVLEFIKECGLLKNNYSVYRQKKGE